MQLSQGRIHDDLGGPHGHVVDLIKSLSPVHATADRLALAEYGQSLDIIQAPTTNPVPPHAPMTLMMTGSVPRINIFTLIVSDR